jgi:hypothetical protein
MKRQIMLGVALSAALFFIGRCSYHWGYPTLGWAYPNPKPRNCSAYCKPDVAKPCGTSCISVNQTCHKDWTTACSI